MQIAIDVFLFLFSLAFLFLLIAYAWRFWLMYVQHRFLASYNKEIIMLEIKLPREIFKSPEATEIAMNAFLQSGSVGSWYNRNITGNLPNYFSLEIVSLEGVVHFYIRTHKKFKQLIQNNFYSQYPGIEITEAKDYVDKVFLEHRSDNMDVNLWGITWNTTNNYDTKVEDTNSEKGADGKKSTYKIKGDYKMFKTYVDYKLDKDPKEEFKHDPLTPILEWLGSLGKNEYGWHQIIISDEGNFNNKKFPAIYIDPTDHKHLMLADVAKKRLKQIRDGEQQREIKFKKGDVVTDDYGHAKKRMAKTGRKDANGKDISEEVDVIALVDVYEKFDKRKEVDLKIEEKAEIEMIHRKIAKPIMMCVMRSGWISVNNAGNMGHNINSTLAMLKAYSPGSNYNSFAPSPTDPYDYSWQNTRKRRVPWRKEEWFEAYVEREGFFPHVENSKGKGNFLTRAFNIHNMSAFTDVNMWNYNISQVKIFKMAVQSIFNPFSHPHPDEVFGLNLEELATFWHLPGQVATTPGIERIDTIKTEAPSNLPI